MASTIGATGRAAALIAAIFLSGAAHAQEVEAWYKRAAEAAHYASIKSDLLAIAAEARKALLTDKPLAERLAEGARKGVAAEQLLSILREESGELVEAAGVLQDRGLRPTNRDASAQLFRQLGIALRAGLEVEDFEAAVRGAIERGGTKAAIASRAVATLSALSGMNLDVASRRAVAAAVAAGPIPVDRLNSVRIYWAELVSRNVDAEVAVDRLLDMAGPGGQGPASSPPDQSESGEGNTAGSAGGPGAPQPTSPSPSPRPQGSPPAPGGKNGPAGGPSPTGMRQGPAGRP